MQTANATLFDGKTALGLPVFASVEGASLRLVSPTGEPFGLWTLATLVRCDPHAPAGAATFRQQTGPERLSVTAADLLTELERAGVSMGHQAAWGARRWSMFAAALLGSLFLGAVLIDQLPRLAVPFVPASLERGWSTTIQNVLTADTATCNTPAGTAALNGLVGRLSTAAGLPNPPPITVLDTSLVNAFTLPDGRILLLRGLIDKASSPDELSGVLAHELGHVRHHDPTREMLRGMALNMLARSLGWGSGVASQMAALSYGRRAEAAADASAVTTLRRAGLRADGLRHFFTTLQTEMGDTPLPFLSDHPATTRRIAALPSDTAGAPALTNLEWQAVQADCH